MVAVVVVDGGSAAVVAAGRVEDSVAGRVGDVALSLLPLYGTRSDAAVVYECSGVPGGGSKMGMMLRLRMLARRAMGKEPFSGLHREGASVSDKMGAVLAAPTVSKPSRNAATWDERRRRTSVAAASCTGAMGGLTTLLSPHEEEK